jgi:TRAP-type C4-dicarboxylate transport system permease large subunit
MLLFVAGLVVGGVLGLLLMSIFAISARDDRLKDELMKKA